RGRRAHRRRVADQQSRRRPRRGTAAPRRRRRRRRGRGRAARAPAPRLVSGRAARNVEGGAVTAARYEIRPYRPGDEDSILAGFNRVFREVCGPGYVDRSMATWRWEFTENPAGNRITVGLHEGVVAAHYAGVPQRVSTAFGDMTFVHIVDSFVVPEHRAGLRRPGLFVETALPWFELCHEMGDAVLYGYPVKTAERIGQRY